MAFANSDLLSYGDYGESADDGYDSDEARAQRMKTNVPSTRPWRAEMQKLIDQGIDVWELEVAGCKVLYRDHTLAPVPLGENMILTTGRRIWDSALVLAKFFANRHYFKTGWTGKRSIELGAGLGVPSLAVAHMGAAEVVVTDVASGIPLLNENIALNAFPADVAINAEALEWGVDGFRKAGELVRSKPFDVVIMSDVLFTDQAIDLLADTIDLCTGPSGLVCCVYSSTTQEKLPLFQVISCCEHRWPGAARFYNVMRDKGFDCTRVPRDDMDTVYGADDFHLYMMRRRGSQT